MRRTKTRGRVCVYQDKKSGNWRVQVTSATGARTSTTCATEGLAREVAAHVESQLRSEVQTVSEAVSLYLAELENRGTTKAHRVSVAARLKLIMPGQDEQLLTELHPIVCQRLYDESRQKGKSVDYQRNALLTARSLCTWLVETGSLASNPFAGIKGVGKRRKGKQQLTIDEARRFLDTCLNESSIEATAALCCLLLALRCSEIVGLQPKSVDDGGTVLRVWERAEDGKSSSAHRLVEIPEVMRERMPELAADTTLNRHKIGHHVRRLCGVAGVTVVGPHALRGTHASLATRAGATSQLVAGTLGHSRVSVTEAHYTERGATEARGARAALRVLSGGRS